MAAPRRKISKDERKQRDALMRVHNWVVLLVLKRLFDEGNTVGDVSPLFDAIQRETGRITLAHAMPGWQWVDETQVAAEVYDAVHAGR